ncbi:MAG: hypothetical protein KDB80_08865 [Planctomycetes bacterium]|nr:hypothetical protein [Planctomycetota bacterium]
MIRTPNLRSLARAVAPCLLPAMVAAQGHWELRYPATSPPSIDAGRMTYDSDRGVAVFFGGVISGTYQTDLWEWDGANWTQRSGTGAPARAYHSMTYDSAREQILVFGGRSTGSSGGETNDLWAWDGNSWTLLASNGPSDRDNSAIVYDPVRDVAVMYGGSISSGRSSSTWEWDGSVWTRRFPAHDPGPRAGHGMVYDAECGKVLLFGGFTNDFDAETWEWDGTDWTERQPPNRPSARSNFGMAYDSARDRTVVFGRDDTLTVDTWEWDGVTWTLNPTASRTPGFAELTYDAMNDEIVAFGDRDHNETWVYVGDPVAEFRSFGAACSGSAGLPTLYSPPGQLPVIGETMALQLLGVPSGSLAFGLLGPSNSMLGSVPLPAPLDAIGMPGCSLLIAPTRTDVIPSFGGAGLWLIPIPNDAAFGGQEFFVQAAVGDPLANALGLTLSNGGAATIGWR